MSSAGAPDPAGNADRRRSSVMATGWQRFVFPGLWLVFLGQTVQGVHRHSSGGAAVAGYVIVGLFCVVYAVAMPAGFGRHLRLFWSLCGVGFALTVVESFFAHQDALVFLVYLGVLTVAANRRWALVAVVTMAVLMAALPTVVPGWGGHFDWQGGGIMLLVAFAMYGFFHIVRTNGELAAARAEVARLAAEGERARISRDLHDLLGHSLTTITVKAGLARRLAERGDPRAVAEIGEVEALTRRTLGDVRAAVAGSREVTLVRELATAREVLRAAAITAELPGSVDLVEPELSETFGWVVREGITNMVRHSHAGSCRITLGPRFIEIADNGSGAAGNTGGSGLSGLRERLAAVGGDVTATGGLNGFRLRAEVPVRAAADTIADSGTPARAGRRHG